MIRSTWRRMLLAVGEFAPGLRRNLVATVIMSVVEGLAFLTLVPLARSLTVRPFESGDAWRWLGVLLVLGIAELALRWYVLSFDYVHSADVNRGMRLRLGDALRRVPMEELTARSSGDMSSVMGIAVQNTLLGIGNIAAFVLNAAMTPIVVLTGLVFIDWRLAVVLALGTILCAPIFLVIRRRSLAALPVITEANAAAAARTVEYAQGQMVFRSTGQGAGADNALHRATLIQHEHQSDFSDENVVPPLVLGSILQISIVAALALGLHRVLDGALDAGGLAAIALAAVRFAEPVALLPQLATVFDLATSSLERIERLLTTPSLPVTGAQERTGTAIAFEHVTFRYQGQSEAALLDVTLAVPERSFTAIVGPSGSGKTTITRLITRYADPQHGQISIGGRDVQSLESSELMKLVSAVFQDVYLFDDTILENIRFGRPNATDEELRAAARAAHVDEFCSRFPKGYETSVGEVGSMLSGGERQRVSIARAILKDAPIVLLDEPTAALDTESERAVQLAIEELVRSKTVIVIAHRLSTIAGADQILVVDEGRIVERGNHASLLLANGKYARMWSAQLADRDWHVRT